ncbi:TMAO reductase system sensor histidine kinase/response regulator TorS [Vibrio sp. 10N.286.49.B3]|uniref:TMAO reductase system sensor histidine kinase/response regulator TorS n=1 Tax=Vibrio sp. 10N.286.49.B3 TaxID=1880855 RepID=UPI000C84A433|nr:TMAO reductase system sensor histidine kinase/response regulator TorS [Vibrio sp. 10N.286.49.B3]PMH44543.1 TMAO reductase system sensor histidine kinase/response regulator TorS [Vibrio sp. 10N.286.49.B3]
MLLATASIGRKLLLSFLVMAVLVLLSAVIGVSGFSFVAKTESNVVNSALPAMIEARQVSELSSRIISSVQTLSNVKTEEQRQASGKDLFNKLNALLTHIQALGSDSFDENLLNSLESTVQQVIDNIAELGLGVESKLMLENRVYSQVEAMRTFSVELEQLTRTQVLNTSTIAVANITHIYDLLEENNIEDSYQALDALIEVDLDLSDRLHELHLLAFKILNIIEEAKTVTDLDRIKQLEANFSSNLTIMSRRIHSVEDPTRSQQMTALLAELDQRQNLFDLLRQRVNNSLQSQSLMQKTLSLFAQLNRTVTQLIESSNQSTNKAVNELSTTLNYAQWSLGVISIIGLLITAFIIWKVVYLSVVKRLTEYSHALLAVAGGDLSININAKGHDELANMGRAIMTARNTARSLKVVAEREAQAKSELEMHKGQLEELVAERTHQLQLTNQRLNIEVENHAKAQLEAEQANRAKSAFLATMSHEIRTPMNGVLGTARLLQESGLDEQQNQYAEIINRSGKNLLAILNDVLDYSKIEAGHIEIRTLPFDLATRVADSFELMQGRANEKSIELNYFIESDVNPHCLGDGVRLSQVLNNLISNAIKFTEQGSIDLYVSLDTRFQENVEQGATQQVLFEVSDTGIGLDEQELGCIFDAFIQAVGGINSTGGTGLGLAICQHIIEALGGEIGVDSVKHEGSRFWFSVPLQQSQEVSDVIVMALPKAEKSKYRAKVLLVEDNPINSLVAEGFLQNLNHQTVIAENIDQALHLFSQQDFDIALLDIHLPDGSGIDLLHQLKAQEEARGVSVVTPMIAVSAHVFAEDVQRYLAMGFDGFLPKPLEKEALDDQIQAALKERVHLGKALQLDQNLPSKAGNELNQLKSLTKPTGRTVPSIDEKWINPDVIRQDVKILGIEKVSFIVDLFVQTSQEIELQLKQAEEEKAADTIVELAHKLKGSAGSLGLNYLSELCFDLEVAVDPLAHLTQSKEALSNAIIDSSEQLKDLLTQLP